MRILVLDGRLEVEFIFFWRKMVICVKFWILLYFSNKWCVCAEWGGGWMEVWRGDDRVFRSLGKIFL